MPQVRGEGVLAGLAGIPWGDLSHAYGPAGDVPGLLRAIASGDAKAARDAVSELFGNIWHQGTVYRATPYAVPFLARMAAAGLRAGNLVQLLGCIAQSTDDATGGSARAAVAAEAGLLIPLLHDADPGIRAGTAWLLAQCRAGDEAFTAVQAQWAAEEKQVVRATLLKAMSELVPARALPFLVRAAAPGASAGERLVAAWACVTAGRPWDDDLQAASLAWLAEGLDLENGWWGDSNHGPFGGLLFDLAGRGDFTEGLRPPESRFRHTLAERTAAEAAADLGPAASPLIPGLLRLLENPTCCPAAAAALLRADPEAAAIPLAGLADYLVTAAGAEHAHFNRQALDLIREISTRDPSAVSAQARARLRDFADRPRRVIQAGTYDDIIRADEALRTALRDLLRDLGEPGGHGA